MGEIAGVGGSPEEARKALRGGGYHWRVYEIDRILPRPEAPGARILLLGCGDGGEVPLLRERGYEPVGLDIRPSQGADVVADAHALPLEDASFDAILSMQVLEHLHAPWVAAGEIERILRPGGWFVGSVAFLKPYHGSYFHMSHLGLDALLRHAGLEPDHYHAAQSLTYTFYGWLLPFLGLRARRAVLGTVDGILAALRRWAWRLSRRDDPDRRYEGRWHGRLPFSFREFDPLRFAPAVVFRARKTPPEIPTREDRGAREERTAPARLGA